MKEYDVQVVLSRGPRICDPIFAEDSETVKRIVLERLPKVRSQLSLTHPDEEIEAVEIYELVKVAAVNVKPRVIV